jgi:hypothetical protein
MDKPTSTKRCVYYRTGCMPVLRFYTDRSKGQGFYSVHCWSDLIHFSLLLCGTPTVPCQQKCHSLESLHMLCSLACSALSASSEKAFVQC